MSNGRFPSGVVYQSLPHIIYIMGWVGSSKLIDNRVGNGESLSNISAPFFHDNSASRTSAIPEFPECRFLSQYHIPCQDFGQSHATFLGAVKSRIPSINLCFRESRSIYFGSNPVSRKYPV